MRTTVELPEELFRQVKAKAALQGVSLKELLTGYVAAGLNQKAIAATGRRRQRSRLPVIRRRGLAAIPNLTPELQAKLEEEADFAKFDRSFGR
jgi:hypothetical protein